MDYFLKHYYKIEEEAELKLAEFAVSKTDKELFEELCFCVFAANSSAKMGLLAVNLLKDVLHEGGFDLYLSKVKGKVRFFNVRSKYLAKNFEFVKKQGGLNNILNRFEDKYELRLFLKKNILGFGMKEASHFLRNIGFRGFAIIDKHVLNVFYELGYIKSNKSPKNEEEYIKLEKKIIDFAKKHELDFDVLDLAFWSFKTGEIIK